MFSSTRIITTILLVLPSSCCCEPRRASFGWWCTTTGGRRCEHDTGATRTAPYTVRPGGPFLGKRSRILAWVTRELARNSECSTPVRPFYGQGGHVVFPAPSGLNGQTKRSERRPAGRARRAPAPGAGPQWAPRVPWGAQPKKQGMRIALPQRSCRVHFVRLIELLHSSSLRRRRP